MLTLKKEAVCFISLSESNEIKFKVNSLSFPQLLTDDLDLTTSTTANNEDPMPKVKNEVKFEIPEVSLSEKVVEEEAKVEQIPRKRRQNVAMSSLANQLNNNNQPSSTNSSSSISSSTVKPNQSGQLINPANFMNPRFQSSNSLAAPLVANNSATATSSSNSINNNDHYSLKNSLINQNANNFNFLQQQPLNFQQYQPSFFPSASARQFNQQSLNMNLQMSNPSLNINSLNEMNQMLQQQQQQRNSALFNQAQHPLLNSMNNGFPNFLPYTQNQSHNNMINEANTKEKINQLSNKLNIQQQQQISMGQDFNRQNDSISQQQQQQLLQTLMQNQNQHQLQQSNLNNHQIHQFNHLNNFSSHYDPNNLKQNNNNIWPVNETTNINNPQK
jgi:hypothetical protein